MRQQNCKVTENILVAQNTYKMTVEPENEIGGIKCGQFLSISTGCGKHLLKRPFAIAAFSKNTLTFYYLIKGGGTRELSNRKIGDTLEVLFPLGNGFTVKDSYKKIALIGGGAGIFALVSIIEKYGDITDAYFGYRTSGQICFEHSCVMTVTDDGSKGEKLSAVDKFLKSDIHYDAIFACGPNAMLKYLKQQAADRQIKADIFISLEERMGCGIGACLTCACHLTSGKKARVCCDGPVFNINEVEL